MFLTLAATASTSTPCGSHAQTHKAHVPEPPGRDPEETPEIPPPLPPDEDIDLPPREDPAPVRDPEQPVRPH